MIVNFAGNNVLGWLVCNNPGRGTLHGLRICLFIMLLLMCFLVVVCCWGSVYSRWFVVCVIIGCFLWWEDNCHLMLLLWLFVMGILSFLLLFCFMCVSFLYPKMMNYNNFVSSNHLNIKTPFCPHYHHLITKNPNISQYPIPQTTGY